MAGWARRCCRECVALRKESVDRNILITLARLLGVVALRKESVDRNLLVGRSAEALRESLSARRAWIEIRLKLFARAYAWVALRKESVDRNSLLSSTLYSGTASLSARRAWIEISKGYQIGR